jgi:hypothetical protein
MKPSEIIYILNDQFICMQRMTCINFMSVDDYYKGCHFNTMEIALLSTEHGLQETFDDLPTVKFVI